MFSNSCSPTLSHISFKKILWESGFQILAKIEMTQNNGYLAVILKRYNFSFQNYDFW